MTSKLSNIFIETLDQAIDGVVVINSQNSVILYNHAAERLWGYVKEEVIGKNVKVLVPHEIRANHDGYVNNNRAGGDNKIVGSSREVPIICKNGSKKWASMSISKVLSDNEILYTAFLKDVTAEVLAREHLKLLSLVTDKTDNAILIIDKKWETIYINQGFTNIFEFSEDDIIGQAPVSLIAPSLSKSSRQAMREIHSAGKAIKRDEMLQTKKGKKLWCTIMSNPIIDEQGELLYAVTIISEITKTKLHEILNQRILSAIAHDEALEKIMEYACHEISKLTQDITPAILKTCCNNNLSLLAAPNLHKEYITFLKTSQIGEGITSTGTAAYRGTSVLSVDIANDPLWVANKESILKLQYTGCLSVPIKGSDASVIGVINFYYKNNQIPSELHYDLIKVLEPLCTLAIEREKQREDIRTLAYYDSLTKLPNRSLLYANAQQALQAAQKDNTKLAFLFLDVDRFKSINDSFGQSVGDQLLTSIAAKFSSKNQQINLTGRLSGDEFVIVSRYQSQQHLNNFIEELRQEITLPLSLDGNDIFPTMSIGISTYPEDGDSVDTLIYRSNMAMCQAKDSGRGRFSYFSLDLNQLAQEKQKLEIELEKAIKHDQLQLHYQPQISMENGSIYGLEALARWKHKTLGDIPPAKFIPIAEECGLIGDLSKWAIHNACKHISMWRKKGLNIAYISVNLSPLNFHNMELCDFISHQLRKYNLSSSDLILELTEGVLLDTNPSTMRVLLDIHEAGIGFSMDDFGTGYSSLSYLQKIPIKELKLDRSFVQDLGDDCTSQALSKAVIQIGKSLNINVVAEGIENERQVKILKQQGYHIAQGFYFCKPLSSEDLEQWLQHHDNNK